MFFSAVHGPISMGTSNIAQVGVNHNCELRLAVSIVEEAVETLSEHGVHLSRLGVSELPNFRRKGALSTPPSLSAMAAGIQ